MKGVGEMRKVIIDCDQGLMIRWLYYIAQVTRN